MTTPPAEDEHGRNLEALPPPEPEGDHGRDADQLLVHGLLAMLHLDDRASQERRVVAVMTALGARARRPRRMAGRRRLARLAGLSGACLVLLLVGVLLILPAQRSARALVLASAHAMRSGDRRFNVYALHPWSGSLETTASATVDTQPPDHLLIRIAMPDGHRVIVGRDERGPWAIRRDGGIEREDVQRAWPRWAGAGTDALFAESIEEMLEELANRYELTREKPEALASDPGSVLQHVVGRHTAPGPGADRIDVWIDTKSGVVERMELEWDLRGEPPPPPHDGGPGPGGHPPPPRRLVFEGVEPGAFPRGWFSPESHADH